MAYSIQQLILLHESHHSHIYSKSDSAENQPSLIKVLSTAHPTSQRPICYNSEYEYIHRVFHPKRTVVVAHSAG